MFSQNKLSQFDCNLNLTGGNGRKLHKPWFNSPRFNQKPIAGLLCHPQFDRIATTQKGDAIWKP
ncbi:hypothetical protein D1823_16235 [Ruegeria sp. AD91A]|nr:hypothetical protein D1823_16235 [Ruegeria sp. AD91A]